MAPSAEFRRRPVLIEEKFELSIPARGGAGGLGLFFVEGGEVDQAMHAGPLLSAQQERPAAGGATLDGRAGFATRWSIGISGP